MSVSEPLSDAFPSASGHQMSHQGRLTARARSWFRQDGAAGCPGSMESKARIQADEIGQGMSASS
jgi:hypothetical protein